MKLQNYTVNIPQGTEQSNGYVLMRHGTKYCLELRNDAETRCDADVHIDGRQVGLWRIPAKRTIRIERPVHDTGQFTFYKIETTEAEKAGLEESSTLGVITVIFKPERMPHLLGASDPSRGSRLTLPPQPGGTGLSGESKQRFTDAEKIEYDTKSSVTINLRLVAAIEEPRPMFPRSNPVPPPAR